MRPALRLAPLAFLAACAPPGTRRADEMVRAPVAVTTEGQRAYDDLAAYYRDPARTAPVEEALKDLLGAAPAARERAGRYLLALFRQAREDEARGRHDWKWVHPETRAAWRALARAFRGILAEPFGRTADGEAALPAALWLVEEEDVALPENQEAGLRVLRRVRSDRSATLFRRLLAQPHPNAAVTCGILEEAGARGMRDLGPDVRRLCAHYRADVRAAARAAATRMGIEDAPSGDPAAAFTPWLEDQLRRIADMTILTLPDDAAWSGAAAGLISSLDGEVRRLLEGRDAPADAGDARAREILAAVAPREPRGKADLAARLFPLLDALPDDRLLAGTVRAYAGTILHAALIRALADERDFLTALVLAHHLAKPLFEGCAFQADARALTEQLPRRLDDFRGFRLPDPDAWARMQAALDRPRRIAFLVERLRLLNRPARAAAGAPAADPFDAPQTALPADGASRLPAAVINPFRELTALQPTVDDIPLLAPHLANDDILPWAPAADGPAHLPRVSRLVARLVNDAACRLLADPEIYFDLADDDRLSEIDRILLWAEANAGKPRARLAREAAEEARTWGAFRFAVGKLAETDRAGARDVVSKRAGDFADQRAGVEALERELGARPGTAGERR